MGSVPLRLGEAGVWPGLDQSLLGRHLHSVDAIPTPENAARLPAGNRLLTAAIVAGDCYNVRFALVSGAPAIKAIALAWMGTSCILNARRCQHTHCAMWWLVLGAFILVGDKLIWWAGERQGSCTTA
jgi:hypothetical protein